MFLLVEHDGRVCPTGMSIWVPESSIQVIKNTKQQCFKNMSRSFLGNLPSMCTAFDLGDIKGSVGGGDRACSPEV